MDPNPQNPLPTPHQPQDGDQPPAPAPLTPSASAPDWQQQAVAGAQANVASAQTPEDHQSPQPPAPDDWKQPQPSSPQPPLDHSAPGVAPAQPSAVITPAAAEAGEPTGGAPVYPAAPTQPAAHSKKMMLIVGGSVAGIIVIAIVILLAVFMFGNSAKKKNTANTNATASQIAQASTDASDKDATDLSTLQSVTLVAPSDMSAYQTPTHLISTYSRYTTKDNACSIDLGQVPTSYTQLEGTDIDGVVAFNIKALRDVGATVSDPVAGDALVLKDTKDPSKTYKLPTLRFTVTKGTAKAFSDYSVAVTKNGDRVVIVRACGSETGPLDVDSLKPLNAVAEKITVTAP